MAADKKSLAIAREAREKVDLLVQALKKNKKSWVKQDILEAIALLKIVSYQQNILVSDAMVSGLLQAWESKRAEAKPLPKPKTVEELYKAIAPFYTKGISNFLFGIEEPVIKKMLPKLKGLKVLDVGCGTGRWSAKFAAAGAAVIGVDKSKAMLKFAKKRAGKAKFLQMDARKLKFLSNSFDIVFESLVLVHLRNWEKAVREMIRVCKPCGLILISDFNGARIFGKQTDVPFSISKKKTIDFPIFAIMPSDIIGFALKNGCELVEFKEPKQKLPKEYIQKFQYQPPLQIIMLRKKH